MKARAKIARWIHRQDMATAKIGVRAHESTQHATGGRSRGFACLNIEMDGTDITAVLDEKTLRKLRDVCNDALGIVPIVSECIAKDCYECKRGMFAPKEPAPPAPEPNAPPVHFTTEAK